MSHAIVSSAPTPLFHCAPARPLVICAPLLKLLDMVKSRHARSLLLQAVQASAAARFQEPGMTGDDVGARPLRARHEDEGADEDEEQNDGAAPAAAAAAHGDLDDDVSSPRRRLLRCVAQCVSQGLLLKRYAVQLLHRLDMRQMLQTDVVESELERRKVDAMHQPECAVFALPSSVLCYTLTFLPLCDVARCFLVCQSWSRFALSEGMWRELAFSMSAAWNLARPRQELSWYRTLKELTLHRRKWEGADSDDYNIQVVVRFRPHSEDVPAEPEPEQQEDEAAPSAPTSLSKVRRMRRRSGFGSSSARFGKGSAFHVDADEPGERSRWGPPTLVSITPREVLMHVPSLGGVRAFHNVECCEPSCPQIIVYNKLRHRLLTPLLAGRNCTIFAYGQTGSGKTHSMLGTHELFEAPRGLTAAQLRGRDVSTAVSISADLGLGVVPRVLRDLLAFAGEQRDGVVSTITVSAVEIFMETLNDLLDDNAPLRIAQDGNGEFRHDGRRVELRDWTDAIRVLYRSHAARRSAATLMNERSSRSHSIFQVCLHQQRPDGMEIQSNLCLVDLAGSERLSKSGATRVQESAFINRSLFTLTRVVASLVKKSSHVPYRDSVLTKLLQPALGGNCMSTILATVSSDDLHGAETLSTLRFAESASCIKNNLKQDIKSRSTIMRELRRRIKALKRMISTIQRRRTTNDPLVASKYHGYCEELAELQAKLRVLRSTG